MDPSTFTIIGLSLCLQLAVIGWLYRLERWVSYLDQRVFDTELEVQRHVCLVVRETPKPDFTDVPSWLQNLPASSAAESSADTPK